MNKLDFDYWIYFPSNLLSMYMFTLVFVYVRAFLMESKYGAKSSWPASPDRPLAACESHVSLGGFRDSSGLAAPVFSLFFINIFFLPEMKPGHPDHTLCPKWVNPEVILQDKTRGQKALVHRPCNSKLSLLLLGFWDQREGVRQPLTWIIDTLQRQTGSQKAEPEGMDFGTVSVTKYWRGSEQPNGFTEDSVLLPRRWHNNICLVYFTKLL